MRMLLMILTATFITGCSTSMTMTGRSYPEVAPLQVKILFKQKPECEYEELAFISTPLKWNQNSAIQSARDKAAEIGADYIMIETVHKNMYNDASVSAVAYKCADVNREKVEVEH